MLFGSLGLVYESSEPIIEKAEFVFILDMGTLYALRLVFMFVIFLVSTDIYLLEKLSITWDF